MIELPGCVVSFTHCFTDMVAIGKCGVKDNPKIFDLSCPVNTYMKKKIREKWWPSNFAVWKI